MLLTYREETNFRIRSQAFLLLEFSPVLESWSDIYMGPTSCRVYIGRKPPDTKNPQQQTAAEFYLWCIDTFQMIFKGRFVASSVDRSLV